MSLLSSASALEPVLRDTGRLLLNGQGERQCAKSTGAAIAEACKVQGRNIEPLMSQGLRRLFTDRCVGARVDVSRYGYIAGHSVEVALKHYRTVTMNDKLAALHRPRRPSR